MKWVNYDVLTNEIILYLVLYEYFSFVFADFLHLFEKGHKLAELNFIFLVTFKNEKNSFLDYDFIINLIEILRRPNVLAASSILNLLFVIFYCYDLQNYTTIMKL